MRFLLLYVSFDTFDNNTLILHLILRLVVAKISIICGYANMLQSIVQGVV